MKTNNDLRSNVALITASINNMCNANNVDDVVSEFVKVKDLLIELYKQNVEKFN